eukprot:g17274.t1
MSHVATVGAPTDDVTSSTVGYATSGTVNTIDTAADATASVSEANTTDTEDAPADTAAAAATNTQDLLTDSAPPTTYPAPPTADADVTLPTADTDVTPPTTEADVALPTASTASSSSGDCSTQPCRVFTIPPDLPLTEDK